MSGLLSSLGDVISLDVNDLLGLDANLDVKGTKGDKRGLVARGFSDFRDSVVMARDLVEREIHTIQVPDDQLHDILDKLKDLENQVNAIMRGSDSASSIEVPHSTPAKTDGPAIDPPEAPNRADPAARPETKKLMKEKAPLPAGAGAFKEKISVEDGEESDGESNVEDDDELETQTVTSTKDTTSTTTKTRTQTTTVTVPGEARIAAPAIPTPEPAPTVAPATENTPPADPAQGGVTIGGYDGSAASGATLPAPASSAPAPPASPAPAPPASPAPAPPAAPAAPVAAAKIKEDHPDTKKNQKLQPEESEKPETGGPLLVPSASETMISVSAPSISPPVPVGPATPVSLVPTPKSFPGHKVPELPSIAPVETPISVIQNKMVVSSSQAVPTVPSGFSTVTLPSATPLSR